MTTQTFDFSSVWFVDAEPPDVVAVLADIDRYPTWWPQVRSVDRIDDDSGIAVVRSLLPVTLRLRLTRVVADREAGVLRVLLAGDLVGHAQWRIAAVPQGSVLHFAQSVRVATRLERVATLVPLLLRANHAWMMRQCRHGLAREVTPRR
ncbi:SRPBCC family protein [Janibacter sp. DB-40]|uniref:SRPBCC family protein n=1 Tax=Janibacter sp. DB-40 TaxID=3028808 RepID=UPI0024050E24|nr:SRPBCC family protein [Janibacter sp. DB-40]